MQKTLIDKILELRLKEIDIRSEMIDCLRNIDATGEYKHTGAKSLREFCMKELGWSYDAIKEVMIVMGKIVPTDKLVANGPAATARLHALIKWRTEKRVESGMAAYQILPNKTMLAIADQNPKSLEQLVAINGVGPKKLELFGKDVLQVINSTNC